MRRSGGLSAASCPAPPTSKRSRVDRRRRSLARPQVLPLQRRRQRRQQRHCCRWVFRESQPCRAMRGGNTGQRRGQMGLAAIPSRAWCSCNTTLMHCQPVCRQSVSTCSMMLLAVAGGAGRCIGSPSGTGPRRHSHSATRGFQQSGEARPAEGRQSSRSLATLVSSPHQERKHAVSAAAGGQHAGDSWTAAELRRTSQRCMWCTCSLLPLVKAVAGVQQLMHK